MTRRTTALAAALSLLPLGQPLLLGSTSALGTVQQAYALIREDIDQANIQRTDLVAQAIHLLMESARVGLKQNNPGAVVGAISQLDKLCGLGMRK